MVAYSELDLAFARFLSYVPNFGEAGKCWEWKGATNNKGYGEFSYNYRTWMAHAWLRTYLHGPLPDGLENDHKCRNRICVNIADPKHVIPATHSENVAGQDISNKLGSFNLSLTHCKRGHAFTDENTYVYRTVAGNKWRQCKECNKLLSKAKYERAKGRAFTVGGAFSPWNIQIARRSYENGES